MQRFINNPDDLVDETVAGFVRAHRDLVRLDPANPRLILTVWGGGYRFAAACEAA